MSKSALEQLREHSEIVIDTANVDEIDTFAPADATTNPSLICSALQSNRFEHLLQGAVAYARYTKPHATPAEHVDLALDKVTVDIGGHILKRIAGRVSTEVDARHSFSAEKSIAKARQLVAMYAEIGVPKERLYIKLAATWEGIQAARTLEAEGIACNLTLIFSFTQALACAQAGVSLISPFVGRILDWHVAHGMAPCQPADEPGVVSVSRIYRYFKAHGYKTIVMGASFRNTGEVVALAGCDKLTISPKLLEELSRMESVVDAPLKAQKAAEEIQPALEQADFLFHLHADAMAIEKLSEGIRKFDADTWKARDIVQRAFETSVAGN